MRRKLGGTFRQWYWDHPGGAHPGNYLVLDQGLLAHQTCLDGEARETRDGTNS